jgi:hypothetical protein
MLFEARLVEVNYSTMYGYVLVFDEKVRVVLVKRPEPLPQVDEYIQVAEYGNRDDSIQAFILPPPRFH